MAKSVLSKNSHLFIWFGLMLFHVFSLIFRSLHLFVCIILDSSYHYFFQLNHKNKYLLNGTYDTMNEKKTTHIQTIILSLFYYFIMTILLAYATLNDVGTECVLFRSWSEKKVYTVCFGMVIVSLDPACDNFQRSTRKTASALLLPLHVHSVRLHKPSSYTAYNL